MTDAVIILVLVLILGGAGLYVYRAKKRGQRCIGCPHARECARRNAQCGK